MGIHWDKLPLTHPRVSAHLEAALKATGYFSRVRLDHNPGRKRLLRLHHDGKGYYVRRGCRGSGKAYLGEECTITVIDGRDSLHHFNLR